MSRPFDQTNLELLRHKIHNIVRKKHVTKLTLSQYWKECGAFISIMPRQSGKTAMLEKIVQNYIKENEKVLVIALPHILSSRFWGVEKMLYTNPKYRSIAHGTYNLIIDEFEFISSIYLTEILDNKWKTVTMASSYK